MGVSNIEKIKSSTSSGRSLRSTMVAREEERKETSRKNNGFLRKEEKRQRLRTK